MPRIKKAIQRMFIITQCIEERPRSKNAIRDVVERRLGDRVCNSTIEKDLFILKEEFDAPIKYERGNDIYYMAEKYSFAHAMINWMDV
jgi:hypothetical protein